HPRPQGRGDLCRRQDPRRPAGARDPGHRPHRLRRRVPCRADLRHPEGVRLGDHRAHRQPDGRAEGRAPGHAEPALRLRGVRRPVPPAVRIRAVTVRDRRRPRAAAAWPRLAAFLLLALAMAAASADTGSRHLVLPADRVLDPGHAVLLATTIDVPRAGWAYLHADGGLAPLGEAIANAWISVDGRRVSNQSVVDWRGSRAPNRHAFNAIAAVRLPAGRARVALHARVQGAPAAVTAGSSLSVLTDAADHAASAFLAEHSPWLAFDTRQAPEGRPLPAGRGWWPVLWVDAGNSGGPVVAMASGDRKSG